MTVVVIEDSGAPVTLFGKFEETFTLRANLKKSKFEVKYSWDLII